MILHGTGNLRLVTVWGLLNDAVVKVCRVTGHQMALPYTTILLQSQHGFSFKDVAALPRLQLALNMHQPVSAQQHQMPKRLQLLHAPASVTALFQISSALQAAFSLQCLHAQHLMDSSIRSKQPHSNKVPLVKSFHWSKVSTGRKFHWLCT